MKIKRLTKLNDFVAAIDNSKGWIFLTTQNGDRYNLKSYFSQYLALERLLSEQCDSLELICTDKEDEKLFEQFTALER